MKNLNLNADFLLDVWADLKAKRLAPVAIGLVVIAVAMPALMLRGEDAPMEGPLPVVAPVAADGAKVEVAEELADGSKLDSYRARDPFEGLVKPEAKAPAGSGAAIAPGDLLGGSGKDPLGSSGGGASSGSSGSTGSSDPGGGGLGSTPGSDPNLGSHPGNPQPPPVAVKRPPTQFNYQLDLKFGRPGREKRYPNVTRLTFLPSQDVPAMMFMGVTVDEKSALFFVYPGLTHQGEGKCAPSRADCRFLKLSVGKEHYLSTEDLEFHIKLLGVKRVKLSEEKQEAEKVRKASRARRSARMGGEAPAPGTTEDPAEEQLELPWLVDGIG